MIGVDPGAPDYGGPNVPPAARAGGPGDGEFNRTLVATPVERARGGRGTRSGGRPGLRVRFCAVQGSFWPSPNSMMLRVGGRP